MGVQPDPDMRYSIEEATTHEFLADLTWTELRDGTFTILDAINWEVASQEDVNCVRQLSNRCHGLKVAFYRRFNRCTNKECSFYNGGAQKRTHKVETVSSGKKCKKCGKGKIVPLPPISFRRPPPPPPDSPDESTSTVSDQTEVEEESDYSEDSDF